MRNSKKFDSAQKAEISEMKEQAKDKKLYKKIEVLDYAAKGYTNREISELTEYSLSRISDYIREYIQNGKSYFTEEHRKGGNRRNLTDEQEKEIVEKFKSKAIAGQVVNISEMKKY